MTPLGALLRAPAAALETANLLLTQDDAEIGRTQKDVVWTHRKTTLYRYRSPGRTYRVPVLLVFALINRPQIFDLRPGSSFVEFLLAEGFDVFLLDWGVADDEDADMGIDNYVCDEIPWGIREVLQASGEDEVSLLGWCMGGTFALMHAALEPAGPARNLLLLTTPVEVGDSTYARWLGEGRFDLDLIADTFPAVPGSGIDFANKLLKPVTNYLTTYRRLFENVLDGSVDREAFQAMSKWVSDNPPMPSRVYREWNGWMYQEDRLIRGRLELRGRRVDLAAVEANLLVVTARSDHIAPPSNTVPLLDRVGSGDVTHIDRSGGHIGLMAGSKARREIWPDIAEWLTERSAH